MNNIGVSTTVLADPRRAARDLVDAACAELTRRPSLAVLFATTDYDTQALLTSVDDALGGVPLWGGSSMGGVFANGQWVTPDSGAGPKGAAALMLVADRPGGAAWAQVADDPVSAGAAATRQAIAQAGGQASALLTLAFMGPEEQLLAGVAQAGPGLPVVGGSASDGGGRFQQFGRGQVAAGAITVAALGGEVGYAFEHGYRLTGSKAPITRAEGRRLVELAHRPALEVYAEWTQAAPEAVREGAVLGYSVFHPLLLHRNGDTLAVHPVSGNGDGSIDTGVAVAPGQVVELGVGTPDEVIAAVESVVRRAAAQVRQPRGLILVHCGGRAIGLGDRIGEVAGQVQRAVGNVPWIGYLAFGEQGCFRPGSSAHGNLSLSALVLG